MLTEKQLALFNRRDHKTFVIVFRHYYGHIKLYAYEILNNETVAEDITIQVFMELLKPSAPFNTEENIKVWLFRRAGIRCLFWDLQEKLKALRKEWMQQNKAIDELITILNELPKKYEQVAPLPDRDPSIYWNFAETVQSILVNGDATPAGNRDVAELASWFAENYSRVEQACDGGWLQEQSIIYKNIDLDERCKTFWSMVAEEQPRKAKVLSIVRSIAGVAAVCIIALTAWFFFVSPGKKTNATAANNVQQQAADYSIRQGNVYKTNSIDSFSSSGLYMQVSTDEAVNEPLYHKVPIPAAGYREIKLADGSKVWLSSMTTFTYPVEFSGNKRKVEITGEAYFEVDANAAQPFLAIVNGIHIETTGGCFNVKAHEQEALKKITVLQGAVRVAAGPYAVLIKENQSALVEQKKRIAIEFNEDTAKVMAWKDRRFLFKNDSLAIVIRELARRYKLELKGNINSDALIAYEGSRLEPVETVLARLQQRNRNFMYTIADRVLTIE
jgi:hypothetical protein